jgi:arginine exporter protein ArgO
MNWYQKLDITQHIAKHIVGEDHTAAHRRAAGLFLMVIGVFIPKLVIHAHMIVHIFAEVIGFAFHGWGLIPFSNSIENRKQQHEQSRNLGESQSDN